MALRNPSYYATPAGGSMSEAQRDYMNALVAAKTRAGASGSSFSGLDYMPSTPEEWDREIANISSPTYQGGQLGPIVGNSASSQIPTPPQASAQPAAQMTASGPQALQPASQAAPSAAPAANPMQGVMDYFGKNPGALTYTDPTTGQRYTPTYSGSNNPDDPNGKGQIVGYSSDARQQGQSWKPGDTYQMYDANGKPTGGGVESNPYSDSGVESLVKAGLIAAAVATGAGALGSAASVAGPGDAAWGMDLGMDGLANTSTENFLANSALDSSMLPPGTPGVPPVIPPAPGSPGVPPGSPVPPNPGVTPGVPPVVPPGTSPSSVIPSWAQPFVAPVVSGVANAVANKTSSGSGSGGSGGSASAYVPTNRAGMDASFQTNYGQFQTANNGANATTAQDNLTTFNNSYNNPNAASFLAGATQAGQTYGQQAGQALDASNSLYGAGNQAYQMAFDPQQALYNKTKQTLVDDTRAAQYARGVSMTPYGAGVEANTLENFGLDWNNQQLARATQGVNTMGSAYKGAAGLGNTGAAMQLASGQTGYDAQNTIYGNQNAAIGNYWNNQAPYMGYLNQLQSNSLGYINGANSAANMGFNQNQTTRTNTANDIAAITGPVSSAINNIWGTTNTGTNTANYGGSTNYGTSTDPYGNPSGYTDTTGSYNNPSAYTYYSGQ